MDDQLSCDFVIIPGNTSYLDGEGLTRESVLGRGVFSGGDFPGDFPWESFLRETFQRAIVLGQVLWGTN